MPRMSPADEPAALLDRMLGGDRRALARLLSLAESEPVRFDAIADRVAAAAAGRAGRMLRVGLTGPGGAGKSSLVDALIRVVRARGETVAVLATDPTSERTGGALLGDRVRLAQDAPDAGVYFRSVATRGAAGGLAHTGFDQADLLEAFGFDWLLLEAVGAGQGEIEVSFACDVTVVVFAPGGGDAVQAMKAGLMEVGDLFCVNKSDLPGADAAAATLRSVLEIAGARAPADVAPVALVSATTGRGVDELPEQVRALHVRRVDSGEAERRRRARLERRVRHLLQRDFERRLRDDASLAKLRAAAESTGPRRLAAEIAARLLR
jgi:LAO/AO transport system kinase